MRVQNNNSGYTILVTLMIIGFLIVLTTGVLNLVLREMNDNRWEAKYLQLYLAAEWAMELALLQIKEKWYWIYNKIELDESNPDSKILRNDKNNKKEVLFWYDLNSKTKSYTWRLDSFKQVVIPLFYMSWNIPNYNKIDNIKLNILNTSDFTDSTKMAWNIVSEDWDWIWWNSNILYSTWKWRDNTWIFIEKNINWAGNFLDSYSKNYLIIINLDSNNSLEYNLSSSESFTKPVSKIVSKAKVGNYKQNLETTLDNTEFLSILKYSIYSN